MATSWTLEDLAAIEKAIASQALKVEYNDRTVTFRSIKELKEARTMIQRALGITKKSGGRVLCKSSKGVC